MHNKYDTLQQLLLCYKICPRAPPKARRPGCPSGWPPRRQRRSAATSAPVKQYKKRNLKDIIPKELIVANKLATFIAVNFAFPSTTKAQEPMMPRARFLITPEGRQPRQQRQSFSEATTAKASFCLTPKEIIEVSTMPSFIAVNFAFRSINRAQEPMMPRARFLITP